MHNFLSNIQIAESLNLININVISHGFYLTVLGLHDIHSQHFFQENSIFKYCQNYFQLYLEMRVLPKDETCAPFLQALNEVDSSITVQVHLNLKMTSL